MGNKLTCRQDGSELILGSQDIMALERLIQESGGVRRDLKFKGDSGSILPSGRVVVYFNGLNVLLECMDPRVDIVTDIPTILYELEL